MRMARVGIGLLALLLFGATAQAAPASQATDDSAGLTMSVEAVANGSNEGGVTAVRVDAQQLKDLYAYSIVLEVDAQKWEAVRAEHGLEGFAVGPLVKGDTVEAALTKVGKTAGTSGDARLATIVLRLKQGEPSTVRLKQVELVNSELQKKVLLPVDLQLQLPGDPALVRLTDIKGHWAETAIRQAVAYGRVSGYTDGSFKPQGAVTRAEFAAMLTRALQLPLSSEVGSLDYTDNAALPDWSKPYIAAVAKSGWMSGYDDGAFRAQQPITRAEVASILARILAADGGQAGAGTGAAAGGTKAAANASFADAAQIPTWAREAVAAVVASGLMQGRGGGQFAPLVQTTRAEAVIVLTKMSER